MCDQDLPWWFKLYHIGCALAIIAVVMISTGADKIVP